MGVPQWFRILTCVLSIAFLNGCATQVLLHPETARRAVLDRPIDPLSHGDCVTVVTITNAAGYRLSGWLFTCKTNRGVVLVGDGNATGMAHTYDYNRFLLNQGFDVLILSYQGYDTNEGPADIRSLVGDVESFYAFCRNRYQNQPIALLAESISTAPFFVCASRHPEIAGAVFEALVNPKTVARTTANDWWWLYPIYPITFGTSCLVSAAVPEELDLRSALGASSKVPALFIHHPHDRITPYRTARAIYNAYGGPKQWISIQSQNRPPYHMIASFDQLLTSRIIAFLKGSVR